MKLVYVTAARLEYERKLARIAVEPFTTHSIADFIEDIQALEQEIVRHPGLRRVAGAPPGYFRTGPSKIYSYSLIYRLHDENIIVIAVAAPNRRPLYWTRRKT